MKAKWISYFDWASHRSYRCPGCPDCESPILLDIDGKYRCFLCEEEVKVTDPEMLGWLEERDETKVEMEDCDLGCDGKGTMETHYVRNPVTLEWQVAFGECKKCGMSFIV